MAHLQKLDILSLGRLTTVEVEVDGGTIIISELGAADSFSLFSDPANQDGKGNLDMARFTPALLARCIVDDSGTRIFDDAAAAGIARMKSSLFNKLSAAAMKINGLAAEAQEAEIKNSEPSPGDSSATG